MLEQQRPLAKWILIVSAIFALLEIFVSISLCFFPDSMADKIDLAAKGTTYIMYMWAARQFALGIIFAYATFKRSVPMLFIAYLFLLVMFIGDLIIGVIQKDNAQMIAGVVMSIIASAMLFVVNKYKRS